MIDLFSGIVLTLIAVALIVFLRAACEYEDHQKRTEDDGK